MLALLAAGKSRRFGDRDKLCAILGGKMLGLHAAEACSDIAFIRKLVIGSPAHDCANGWQARGFEVVNNIKAAEGQATSVRLAAEHAIGAGVRALCIMLADMPFVTQNHIEALIAAFEQSDGAHPVASSRRGQAMPPAIFPAAALDRLIALEGDTGARGLLAAARLVPGNDSLLMDIDSEDDLARANDICQQSE